MFFRFLAEHCTHTHIKLHACKFWCFIIRLSVQWFWPPHKSRSQKTGSWWAEWFPLSFQSAGQTYCPQGWWESCRREKDVTWSLHTDLITGVRAQLKNILAAFFCASINQRDPLSPDLIQKDFQISSEKDKTRKYWNKTQRWQTPCQWFPLVWHHTPHTQHWPENKTNNQHQVYLTFISSHNLVQSHLHDLLPQHFVSLLSFCNTNKEC